MLHHLIELMVDFCCTMVVFDLDRSLRNHFYAKGKQGIILGLKKCSVCMMVGDEDMNTNPKFWIK